MMKRQVMIYEIKSSADKNSSSLFSSDGKYFYWNQKKFRFLNNEDIAIVVNIHSKYCLFTSLAYSDIPTSFDRANNSSYFEHLGVKYNVDGKWNDFVCLEILEKSATPPDWKWKSLGSSETTYLNGERVNSNSSNNRLLNINQLQEMFSSKEAIKTLNESKSNFNNNKNSFKPELLKFLNQADTNELSTKQYISNYLGTDVKVSFGKGVKAKIPWISFLLSPNTTNNGIYPVYLLYKEANKLILAYGKSEEHKSKFYWDIGIIDTIYENFENLGFSKPSRYGDSMVYKSYNINEISNSKTIDEDLNSLIEEYKEKMEFKMKLPSITIKRDNMNLNTILYGPPGTGKTYNSIKNALEIINEHEEKVLNWGDRSAVKALYDKRIAEKKIVFTTFHQSMSYEDFIEGIKPVSINGAINYEVIPGIFKSLCDDIIKTNYSGNKVIIIDEINRGNVASIFGELITLIEPDKRYGNGEQMVLTLPYSKEEFKVPKNLYIIGTMNTADKSIETLDAALRRRFVFEELSPNPELVKLKSVKSGIVNGIIDLKDGNTIDLEQLLKTINERIEKLIDKDHQIGHSYFMNVDSKSALEQCFLNNIIPLLEEYFFGDYGKIGLVLGESFVQKQGNKEFKFSVFKSYDSDIEFDLRQKDVYKIRPTKDWKFNLI